MSHILKLLVLSPALLLSFFVGPKAAIEWISTEYDFGQIKQNVPVSVEFEFKNPGMIPLIVEEVKSSCGCTVPNYPKAPIMPGKTGKIIVNFDAKDSGYFSKTITVRTNTEEPINQLFIKGTVK